MGRRVVIVSTGRTGTRSIASYLGDAHADIDAFHISRLSTLFNVLSNAWLSGLLPTSSIDTAWRVLKQSTWRATTERRILVDSNNHLYAWSRHLMTQYPDLKMVHVVRDPRSYVKSHLRWARQRPKSWIANYMIPFWQPNPFLLGETGFFDCLQMDSFERFCWIWDFKNRFMRETGSKFPKRYFRVALEALTSPDMGSETIEQLESFIGVRSSPSTASTRLPQLNQTSMSDDVPWAGLSEDQCQKLERWCGAQMREYGYGREESWLAWRS